MKILKYLVITLISLLPSVAGAVEYNDVDVNANINIDLYSTVNLIPSTVEISQPSTVEIRIVDPNGNPLSGHTVEIVSPGLSITQPTSNTSSQGKAYGSVSANSTGTYTVCAKDVTYGYDITISNCKTLYVVPLSVPSMIAEPYYTKGISNTVYWNTLGTGYSYYVQVSDSSSFANVLDNSGWISINSYEFNNLSNGDMYFYRVKARNQYGGESAWSNTVFSVQDSQVPNIEILSLGNIGKNNTTRWNTNYIVNMSFTVTDNLELDSTDFVCIRSGGGEYECSTYSLEGTTLKVNIKLDELERSDPYILNTSYSFCVEARDKAGNRSQLCDIKLDIPVGTEEPIKPPTVIDNVVDRIDKINENIDKVITNIGKDNVEIVNTTVSVVTLTSVLTLIGGGILEIPYILFQMFLNILILLGLRKKGKKAGFVYDSVTKEPIQQAIVRIFNDTGKLVWSDVSNINGYFFASLENGKYKIKVSSSKYEFPSNVVFGKSDYPLENVYHGEVFEVSSDEEINFAIPLDSIQKSSFLLLWEGIFNRLRVFLNTIYMLLFILGFTFAVYAYISIPSILNMFIIFIFFFSLVFSFVLILKKRIRYGIVKDEKGNRLKDITIGIRELEFYKIVGKRVTDRLGRYRFVVSNGSYQLEILDTGYKIDSIKGGDAIIFNTGSENVVDRDIYVSSIVE